MVISQHNPTNDILRILVNMKQRWNPQDRGRRLVGAIKSEPYTPRVGIYSELRASSIFFNFFSRSLPSKKRS